MSRNDENSEHETTSRRAVQWTGGPTRRPACLGPPSERHLQCAWYDARLRPPRLRTLDGQSVIVEHPEAWNLEAGPDFRGAVARVGAEGRRVRGGMEIHVRPADWHRHAHAEDPRYADVRFHVTYYETPSAALSPDVIAIAIGAALASTPEFSFDAIDVTSYRYAARAAPTPCSSALAAWTPAERERLLLEAGLERLRRKTLRMAARMAVVGADQTLYEEFLAALGYKHNKGPCRRLAQRVPWAALVAESAGEPARAYALLLGVSGLSTNNRDARDVPRGVWDYWWKLRCRWGGSALSASEWRLDGVRPMNRPTRRLRAAAIWALRRPSPAAAVAALSSRAPAEFVQSALASLTIADPFAAGARQPNVLGRARATAILINVCVPFVAALTDRPVDAEWAMCLPDEPTNGVERLMAHMLFGPDHPPSLRRGPLRRQRLAQMFEDFCLNDRSRCADCPLPRCLAVAGLPRAGNVNGARGVAAGEDVSGGSESPPM